MILDSTKGEMTMELTALFPPNESLTLEYELLYGRARRELDVSDLFDNPLFEGKLGIFGPTLQEHLFDLSKLELGALDHYAGNPLLVGDE
jgi:hypothetical protein